ncbi:MAG: hypothetical protein QOK02_4438 [Mycobacterium sp.]|nr:hypothetical protein [Mycobacterium sp.]
MTSSSGAISAGSGDRIRTCDLWVPVPCSHRLLRLNHPGHDGLCVKPPSLPNCSLLASVMAFLSPAARFGPSFAEVLFVGH